VPVHWAPPSSSLQTLGQAEGVPHAPLDVQVSMPLPLHFDWAGAQLPAHFPPTQVWLTHAIGSLHVPASLHDSIPLFTHCTAPDAQPMHSPFEQTGVAPWHWTSGSQAPATQIWTDPFEHCFCPSAQTP
jgi:hypothetical protein